MKYDPAAGEIRENENTMKLKIFYPSLSWRMEWKDDISAVSTRKSESGLSTVAHSRSLNMLVER